MPETLLRTQEVSKVYRTDDVETTALQAINLDVAEGEFVALMGPSGCGKSTLLNLIGLLDPPSAGEIWFRGTQVSRYTERQRAELRKAHIGFIFQSFNLIEELTVYENIELPLVYRQVSAAERRSRVQGLLEQMQIAHRARHFPSQLSGGQQQRVAVARAVVARPSLILADEPTGNLDSQHGEEVMRLLIQLNQQGATLVMVTHSDYHAGYARRIVRLFDGRVVSSSPNVYVRENKLAE